MVKTCPDCKSMKEEAGFWYIGNDQWRCNDCDCTLNTKEVFMKR